jgi:hypothetical protein
MTDRQRARLLELKPGQDIVSGDMTATRCHPHRPNAPDPREIQFAKHYLEGKLTCRVTLEAIQDMLPDPWQLIEERLDAVAAEQRAHHRDGRRVAAPSPAPITELPSQL